MSFSFTAWEYFITFARKVHLQFYLPIYFYLERQRYTCALQMQKHGSKVYCKMHFYQAGIIPKCKQVYLFNSVSQLNWINIDNYKIDAVQQFYTNKKLKHTALRKGSACKCSTCIIIVQNDALIVQEVLFYQFILVLFPTRLPALFPTFLYKEHILSKISLSFLEPVISSLSCPMWECSRSSYPVPRHTFLFFPHCSTGDIKQQLTAQKHHSGA